jgi:hypothetical protein
VESCNTECNSEPSCATFEIGVSGGAIGICNLYRNGCTYMYDAGSIVNNDFQLYEKVSTNEMNNCKMAYHFLSSNHGGKIQCENEESCDKIKINVS